VRVYKRVGGRGGGVVPLGDSEASESELIIMPPSSQDSGGPPLPPLHQVLDVMRALQAAAEGLEMAEATDQDSLEDVQLRLIEQLPPAVRREMRHVGGHYMNDGEHKLGAGGPFAMILQVNEYGIAKEAEEEVAV
jgi:hypothetical protein